MDGTIAITDYGWYDFLRRQEDLTEVNFWKPSARRTFRAPEYSPFLFKLRSPHNAICGFGFFARYSRLEDWFAWDCFGTANGCASFIEMRDRIEGIRERIRYRPGDNPRLIGCILVVEPVFFPPDAWVPQPRDWPVRTQTDKRYDLSVGEGHRVWEECLSRTALIDRSHIHTIQQVPVDSPRFGSPTLIRPRLGQGTFRVAVSEAYGWGCAMTREHSRPALDAAHIRPYQYDGPHAVENGLLLRADVHRLFDKGYITVTPELRIEVSERLRDEYHNGRSYYPLHGREVQVPRVKDERPSRQYLSWHNENVFLG